MRLGLLWSRNDERMWFCLSPTENSRPLKIVIVSRIGPGKIYSVELSASILLFVEFILPHLRDALSGRIQPFSQENLSIFGIAVGGIGLESLLNQRAGQKIRDRVARPPVQPDNSESK